jgi:hypothetical protein
MISFDPMAAAVDWFDAYRAGELATILEMYDDAATLECWCDGQKTIVGKLALWGYWRDRLLSMPARKIADLQPSSVGVTLSYTTEGGVGRAVLDFKEAGKIQYCLCGPIE